MNRRTNPLTWLAVALVVAIGLMVVFGTLAMTTYGGYYGMMGGGSWAWGLVMMAVPGTVLVMILLAAIAGLGQSPSAPAYPVSAPNPLDILAERYARGELSHEEYLRARDDLGSGRANS